MILFPSESNENNKKESQKMSNNVEAILKKHEPVAEPGKRNEPIHILVVDDETAITELVSAIIRRKHPLWKIEVKNTWEDAVDYLTIVPTAMEPLDCLLTDYNLDDYGFGTDLAPMAKLYHSQCKIILMSGMDAETARAEREKADIDYFLEKPFTMEQLEAAFTAVGLIG